MHMMIQIDNCGLLNHVRRIDWLKALVAYLIDKEEESSLQFGKVYLSPMFIYTLTHQSFPTKLLNSLTQQSFSCHSFMVYSRNLKFDRVLCQISNLTIKSTGVYQFYSNLIYSGFTSLSHAHLHH